MDYSVWGTLARLLVTRFTVAEGSERFLHNIIIEQQTRPQPQELHTLLFLNGEWVVNVPQCV